MQRRLRIYLDTSVPNAYLDMSHQHRQEITQNFWQRLNSYETFISDLVIEEIEATPNEELRRQLLQLVEKFPRLSGQTTETRELVQAYLTNGIFTEAQVADATHVAIATVHRLDTLVSWNQRHIVRSRTRIEVILTNLSMGYGLLDIATPEEML